MNGRPVAWSAASTLATGLLGWITLVVVGRSEGPVAFASFAAVWGVFFGVGGALAGLQQETTRAVVEADRAGRPTTRLAVLTVLVLPVAALAAASASTDAGPFQALGMAVGILGLGVLTFVAGGLAARDRWRTLAALMSTDALIRTVAVLACVGADRPDLYSWAIALGAFAWLPLLVTREVREALATRSVLTTRALITRAVTAMVTSGSAALLVAGLPMLVALSRGGDLGSTAGVLLATLVLVRAPLLVVLYGFRPVVLRGFLRSESSVRRGVVDWWVRLGALGTVGVALAAVIGPSLVRMIFGDDYSTDPIDLAALAAGSVIVGMLVISGIGLVAEDRHAASAMGWLVAVAASVTALGSIDSERTAVLVACATGPLAGLGVHLAALARPSVRTDPHGTSGRTAATS